MRIFTMLAAASVLLLAVACERAQETIDTAQEEAKSLGKATAELAEDAADATREKSAEAAEAIGEAVE